MVQSGTTRLAEAEEGSHIDGNNIRANSSAQAVRVLPLRLLLELVDALERVKKSSKP
jgi:hypothetical protein